MYEDDLLRFNTWYQSTYPKLLNYSQRNRIPQDVVNDSYLKVIEKIDKTGFVGDTFMTYCKMSITNMHINNLKKNKYHHVDVSDINFLKTIEHKLLEDHEDMLDSVQYQEDLLYFSKNLFKYIETRDYSDEWKFIFRSYFLSEGRFTYRKLTMVTGYNKNLCTKVITTMKRDIKDNLTNWIKDNDRTRDN
jgi:hypothetical protein